MRKAAILPLVFFALSTVASAQFYQTGSGSYMTGYGQVNGSFGYAMATQNLYNTTQMQIQRLTMRAAMVKKWGEAAVRKAEANAKGSSSSTNKTYSSTATGPVAPPPPPAPKYYGRFRPDPTVNMAKTISEALAEAPADRALMKQTIDVVKAAYDKEAATRGWKNNFAAAMTFFLVSMSTVYHDSPEPNDEVVNAIYTAVNQAIDEVPEFAKTTNKDKHQLNDMLVGFAALPYATYAEGKQNGSAETLEVAKAWAGNMIKLVLKTEPENVKFDNGALTISK